MFPSQQHILMVYTRKLLITNFRSLFINHKADSSPCVCAGWPSMPCLSSFHRCNNQIVTYMIDCSVSEFISFKYCLLYLIVHNCGPKLLICGHKNQHSEIYNLDMSENDSALLHPTLPCILFFSQDFSHKTVSL